MTTSKFDTLEPRPGDGEQPSGHEYFLELCALSTSDSLGKKEWSQLRSHLEECRDCQEAIAGFQLVAVEGMPLLANLETDSETYTYTPTENRRPWSRERTKDALLAKALNVSVSDEVESTPGKRQAFGVGLPVLGRVLWQQAAQYIAVAVCLLAGVAVGGYRLGLTRVPLAQPVDQTAAVRASELNHEVANHPVLDKAQDNSGEQEDGERDLKQKVANTEALRTVQAKELDKARTENAALQSQRDSLARVVAEQTGALSALHIDVDALQAEKQDRLLHIYDLETLVRTLRKSSPRESVLAQQSAPTATETSVSDSDLRDLMGARKLYITDVVDLDNNGRPRQPFGRIFYTTGKSLIFYAFDLDQQPGVRSAAFQLWGQRGSNRNDFVNMGVFNLDSETNRRWVVKFDDPQKLAQINAVFVTVEPIGGSHKPAGKQLLYASIRTLPNHP
jgi:hypothetical protein